MQIRSGTNQIHHSGNVHKIKSVIVLENYDAMINPPSHDIAAVKVEHRFRYIRGVQEPVALIKGSTEIPGGVMSVISGWGLHNENDHYFGTTLYKARVPIVSLDDCNRNMYVPRGQILCWI